MRFHSLIRDIIAGPSREEIERRYLDQSVSRIDLERRQREIDEGFLLPRF